MRVDVFFFPLEVPCRGMSQTGGWLELSTHSITILPEININPSFFNKKVHH